MNRTLVTGLHLPTAQTFSGLVAINTLLVGLGTVVGTTVITRTAVSTDWGAHSVHWLGEHLPWAKHMLPFGTLLRFQSRDSVLTRCLKVAANLAFATVKCGALFFGLGQVADDDGYIIGAQIALGLSILPKATRDGLKDHALRTLRRNGVQATFVAALRSGTPEATLTAWIQDLATHHARFVWVNAARRQRIAEALHTALAQAQAQLAEEAAVREVEKLRDKILAYIDEHRDALDHHATGSIGLSTRVLNIARLPPGKALTRLNIFFMILQRAVRPTPQNTHGKPARKAGGARKKTTPRHSKRSGKSPYGRSRKAGEYLRTPPAVLSDIVLRTLTEGRCTVAPAFVIPLKRHYLHHPPQRRAIIQSLHSNPLDTQTPWQETSITLSMRRAIQSIDPTSPLHIAPLGNGHCLAGQYQEGTFIVRGLFEQ